MQRCFGDRRQTIRCYLTKNSSLAIFGYLLKKHSALQSEYAEFEICCSSNKCCMSALSMRIYRLLENILWLMSKLRKPRMKECMIVNALGHSSRRREVRALGPMVSAHPGQSMQVCLPVRQSKVTSDHLNLVLAVVAENIAVACVRQNHDQR